MFSLFRKKTAGFAGETAATILYSNWKDDTLAHSTNRSEWLCYSGQEKSSRIGHGAPGHRILASQWTRVGGLLPTLLIDVIK